MSQTTTTVTDKTFETDVLESPVPVLVDYWAEWCPPCKMIAPLLEKTAADFAGRLTVAKVDIDENPQLASRYHVRSIPTLMLFRNGQPVATHVGALSAARLAELVEPHLADAALRRA